MKTAIDSRCFAQRGVRVALVTEIPGFRLLHVPCTVVLARAVRNVDYMYGPRPWWLGIQQSIYHPGDLSTASRNKKRRVSEYRGYPLGKQLAEELIEG